MTYRTCPSCGRRMSARHFFANARRCRRCVAKETAQQRSAEVTQERARLKDELGLRVSISGRRFRHLQENARGKADLIVPRTRRDGEAAVASRLSEACAGAIVIALGIMLFRPKPGLIAMAGLGLSYLGLMFLSERLSESRQKAVRDVADAILRESIDQYQDEQLEYLRFYATREWRDMRSAIIRRDGRVCQMCHRNIALARNLTIDHVQPRSKYPERALDPSNLRVVCRRCNSEKGTTETT
jgi:hypothetical protein